MHGLNIANVQPALIITKSEQQEYSHASFLYTNKKPVEQDSENNPMKKKQNCNEKNKLEEEFNQEGEQIQCIHYQNLSNIFHRNRTKKF